MASEWPPAPPEGYRLHDPEYEQPWHVTSILSLWLGSVLVGVPALVISVHGLDTVSAVFQEVLQPEGRDEWVIYLGWAASTIGIFAVSHESLHALCGRWFGLRTKFLFQYENPLDWSPAVLTYGGFQSRGESLIITLAPLVMLTPASLIVLVWSQHLWVVASAAVIALGNAAGAVGDLASAWVLWSLPDGELLYHDSTGRRQYYTPVNR